MRGNLVSRPASDVLREAERLVNAGVKELLVISQDTSAYGLDLKYSESQWKDHSVRARFYDLAKELGDMGVWVRMHYVYPYPHVDDVIELMAEGKILPYLDIPFQHASPTVLRNMKRPAHLEKINQRIEKWRSICPDIALRSTFIVGFPGETEDDFQMLLDWMSEVKIDRAGCFKYEPVKGATANDMGLEVVPDDVKESRWNRFMAHQKSISSKLLKKKVGKRFQVLVDQANGHTGIGRTRYDAPEVDGVVHLSSRRPIRVGELVTVKIEQSDDYDLYGMIV